MQFHIEHYFETLDKVSNHKLHDHDAHEKDAEDSPILFEEKVRVSADEFPDDRDQSVDHGQRHTDMNFWIIVFPFVIKVNPESNIHTVDFFINDIIFNA